MTDLEKKLTAALNVVGKWRTLFVGWQLGTRAKGDPEADAVSDHRELSLLLRMDTNVLMALLLEKGVFTREEYQQALLDEAIQTEKDLESRFPGVRANESGLVMDKRAIDTLKGWKK
jgi:hypothetical protein